MKVMLLTAAFAAAWMVGGWFVALAVGAVFLCAIA
jgi:hypothetical protein